MSQSPIPLCGHWPADSDSSSVLNHPGVRSQPVLPTPLFRPAPKIIESVLSWECHGAPISPLAFSFFFFFVPSFLSLFPHLFLHLCLFLFVPFSSFSPLNLRLPPIPHCKGTFWTALMERLLSYKDCSHCGTATTNRIFCGQSESALSSPADRERENRKEKKEKGRVWVRFIHPYSCSIQRKVQCVFRV